RSSTTAACRARVGHPHGRCRYPRVSSRRLPRIRVPCRPGSAIRLRTDGPSDWMLHWSPAALLATNVAPFQIGTPLAATDVERFFNAARIASLVRLRGQPIVQVLGGAEQVHQGAMRRSAGPAAW